MNTADLLYLIFVILTLMYTVIDSFTNNQINKRKFIVFLYIPAAIFYVVFTVNYIMQANIYESRLDKSIDKAIIQENSIKSLMSASEEQNVITNNLINEAREQGNRLKNISSIAKNQENNFKEFIKKEMIIREFSIKVRYVIHTKTKANQIRPFNFTYIAQIVNINNSATDIVEGKSKGDIQLVSPVDIKYPSDNVIEICFNFEPSNYKDVIGKPISFLGNYFGVRLFFNKNRFIIKEEIDDNIFIEAYIYINNRLYHTHEVNFPVKYNRHIYYKKDGLFSNIEEKYLGMIGLKDNTFYKNIISGN